MTYGAYKNQDIQTDDLKIFFAFSNKQFDEGLQKLNARHNTDLTEKDICAAGFGMYGTRDDITEFFRRSHEKNKKIPELFTPQTVYNYEYNNHECGYTGDDYEAIKNVMDIYGAEAAQGVKRKCACATIGELAPNFDGLAQAAWSEVRKREAAFGYEFTDSINGWLSGFLTPEIGSALKAQGKACIEANWAFWTDKTVEVMAEFENYGTKFAIYRITENHKYCGVRFNTYMYGYAGQENEQYPYSHRFLAYAKPAESGK